MNFASKVSGILDNRISIGTTIINEKKSSNVPVIKFLHNCENSLENSNLESELKALYYPAQQNFLLLHV